MAYVISDLRRRLLPVLVVLDVPPLDLQGGGGARPTERTRHLHIVAAPCCDVAWHLCKESWKRSKERSQRALQGRQLHLFLISVVQEDARLQKDLNGTDELDEFGNLPVQL